uniref:G protein-coupled receptor 135 n=1 Tax=Sphenodon punctatus TaxID=8508 RepID=A0A8D0HQG4_SPHPU
MESSALRSNLSLAAAGSNESGLGEVLASGPAGGEVEAAWGGWSGAALASQALLLLLIFALSALGNGVVVAVIARHRQLRTVTNAFVLSLSLSELLGALLCLPLAFLSLLSGRPHGAWLFGQRLCLASAALHAGLGIAATLTMALLSFDRYCAIVRQPRHKMGRRRAAQLLAAVWLAALGFAGPWYLLAQAATGQESQAEREEQEEKKANSSSSYHCMYVLPWGSSRLGPPYSVALIVLCYLLPFALMFFCHYNICRAVRLSESRVRPLTTYGHLLRFYGEMRTATTVLIMIVSIICCWGPYCVLGLAAAAGHLPFSPTMDTVASWMAWANGAINPLIYAARNPNISMLLGRSREGGYRTRNNVAAYLSAAQGHRLDTKSRAERYASRGGPCGVTTGSTLSSSSPASGGEVAMWACKNPAVLFCRDGQPDTASEVALQPKADTVDTSL